MRLEETLCGADSPSRSNPPLCISISAKVLSLKMFEKPPMEAQFFRGEAFMSEIARRLRLAMSEVLPSKPIFAHFQTLDHARPSRSGTNNK